MSSIRKSIYTIFRGKGNTDMNQLTIQLSDFSLAQLNKRLNITFEKKKKKDGEDMAPLHLHLPCKINKITNSSSSLNIEINEHEWIFVFGKRC